MTTARRAGAALACAFVLAVLTVVVGAPRARAACDPAPASEQGYVDAADVAFDGLAVAKSTGDPNNTWTFRVDNKVKGSPANQQDVLSPKDTATGMQFTIGTSYRVYAKKQADGSLLTTNCSGDHPTSSPPPLSTTTTIRTVTTSASAPTPTTARSSPTPTVTVTTFPLTVPPTTTPFVLSPATTAPFTTAAGGNNVAIKEQSPPHTNRLVIGLILGAAVAAIGAGVVLWRRGP